MNAYLAVAGLMILTGFMLAVPLIPAFNEVCRKTDAEPLNVIQRHAGDIRHFAQSFSEVIKELKPVLESCHRSGAVARGVLSGGSEYLVIGNSKRIPDLVKQGDAFTCSSVVAFAGDFVCPGSITFSQEIYAHQRFTGGKRNQYRAVLGESDVSLGPASTILRWAHSDKILTAAEHCALYGRISAGQLIRLEHGCTFLRVNAPRIEVGAPASKDGPQISDGPAINRHSRRMLHDGDFEIRAGEVVHSNIVTRGKLIVRAGARVAGSVKSNKDMLLEHGAIVEGSVISAEQMVIGQNCSLRGPVIAERKMIIRTGTNCGDANGSTTVSSPEIEVEEGVLIFGTLWARQSGRVVGRQ
jgi:cytoskeletal protein CcmA (bactofilin family)